MRVKGVEMRFLIMIPVIIAFAFSAHAQSRNYDHDHWKCVYDGVQRSASTLREVMDKTRQAAESRAYQLAQRAQRMELVSIRSFRYKYHAENVPRNGFATWQAGGKYHAIFDAVVCGSMKEEDQRAVVDF